MNGSPDFFNYMNKLNPDDRKDLEKLMMQFARTVGRRTERIEALERRLQDYEELSSRLRELETEVTKQGEKIQHLLARQNQQRVDVATGQDVHHRDIADRYRDFREQRVPNAVRASLLSTVGDRIDRREMAARTSALCAELFGQTLPRAQAVRDILSGAVSEGDAERLCAIAKELRNRAESLGGDPTWVFDDSPHSLRPDQREPVAGAPEGGDIEFVVAPAYLARGKVHCTQLVWTANRPPPDPGHAAVSVRVAGPTTEGAALHQHQLPGRPSAAWAAQPVLPQQD